jgi:beta-glucosidase
LNKISKNENDMKRFLPLIAAILIFAGCKNSKTDSEGAEMDVFVSDLMAKMTVQEKIGQLNLVTPGGGILTGSVVSTDVESKIKGG